MRTHCDCIANVMREFFIFTEGHGWTHIRADAEIALYHEKSLKAKASALTRWKNIKKNQTLKTKNTDDANALQTQYERNANQNQNIESKLTLSESMLPSVITEKPLAKARAEKGYRLSKDWKLPKDWGNWALGKGLSKDIVLLEAEKFYNHWTSTTKNPTRTDWEKTWHNWILKIIGDGMTEKKTFAEKTQDFKDKKALKTHHALLNADDQTLKELGLL